MFSGSHVKYVDCSSRYVDYYPEHNQRVKSYGSLWYLLSAWIGFGQWKKKNSGAEHTANSTRTYKKAMQVKSSSTDLFCRNAAAFHFCRVSHLPRVQVKRMQTHPDWWMCHHVGSIPLDFCQALCCWDNSPFDSRTKVSIWLIKWVNACVLLTQQLCPKAVLQQHHGTITQEQKGKLSSQGKLILLLNKKTDEKSVLFFSWTKVQD